LYGCETRFVILMEEHRLKVNVGKFLRKVRVGRGGGRGGGVVKKL
jgi:hypothetical protein